MKPEQTLEVIAVAALLERVRAHAARGADGWSRFAPPRCLANLN